MVHLSVLAAMLDDLLAFIHGRLRLSFSFFFCMAARSRRESRRLPSFPACFACPACMSTVFRLMACCETWRGANWTLSRMTGGPAYFCSRQQIAIRILSSDIRCGCLSNTQGTSTWRLHVSSSSSTLMSSSKDIDLLCPWSSHSSPHALNTAHLTSSTPSLLCLFALSSPFSELAHRISIK